MLLEDGDCLIAGMSHLAALGISMVTPQPEPVPLGRHAGGGMADPAELKALAEQISAMIS